MNVSLHFINKPEPRPGPELFLLPYPLQTILTVLEDPYKLFRNTYSNQSIYFNLKLGFLLLIIYSSRIGRRV